MRIIAGVAKGRNLVSVANLTRPTSDRAREALFSSIQSEFGDFSGINFLDLYAGSGAVGLEALSRGFSSVVAVEKDNSACETIIKNFELVKKANPPGKFQLISSSVEKFLSQSANSKFDVIFLDPPYETENAEVESILNLLIQNNYLNSESLVVAERPTKGVQFNWPLPPTSSRNREYGTATFYFATFDL